MAKPFYSRPSAITAYGPTTPVGEFLGTVMCPDEHDIYLSVDRDYMCYQWAAGHSAVPISNLEERLVEDFYELIEPLVHEALSFVDPSISPNSRKGHSS